MPFSSVPAAVIALTADGSTAGTVTVAVANAPKVGQKGYLFSSVAGSLAIQVIAVNATTGVVTLRQRPLTNADIAVRLTYGAYGDLSAWKLADSASLQFEAQDIPTQPLYRGVGSI